MTDTTFRPPSDFDELVESVLAEIRLAEEPAAVLLIGSVSRATSVPGSDLDLLLIHRETPKRRFEHETVLGKRVELHHNTLKGLEEKLSVRPELAWGLLDARGLLDPEGVAKDVRSVAAAILDNFVPDLASSGRVAYWLETASEKALASESAGDLARAALIAHTSTYKLLEAIWLVNGLPCPSSSALLAFRPWLDRVPQEFDSHLETLLLGQAAARVESFVRLSTWAVEELALPASGENAV